MASTQDKHPRVIVQSGGRFHSYHIARACESHGTLSQFLIDRHRPSQEHGIDREKIKVFPSVAYLRHFLSHAPVIREIVSGSMIGDSLFDRRASKMIRECDVFHGFLAYSLLGMRRAKELGCKLTVIETGSIHIEEQHSVMRREYSSFGVKPPSRLSSRWVERQVQEYREADLISVPSTLVRNSLLRNRVPKEKILLQPYGVSLDMFYPPASRSEDMFRIIFVGNISYEKGVQYLLPAVRSIQRKDIELLLVGRVFSNIRPILREFKGVYKHISHVDHVSLRRLYQSSSVLVLPSVQDGYPMVVLEAMACGLPVVISEGVGTKDCVQDGETGYVIESRSANAIAQALLRIYSDTALRNVMSARAVRAASRSWEDYGNSWDALYRELVNHGPPPNGQIIDARA